MIDRVVWGFCKTKKGQAAPKTQRAKIAEIYEIRLQYRSDRSRDGVQNNIVYTSAANVTFPIRSINGDGMFFVRGAADAFGCLEYCDECMMSVIVKNNPGEVSGIMVNSGGFDIKTYRESEKFPEMF